MPDPYSGGINRRKDERIKQLFSAKFRLDSSGSDKWNIIFLRDLSAGGMLFNHGTKASPGDGMDIELTFPPSDKPIQCRGTVLRTNRWEEPLDVYQIAVQFVDIDRDQQALIRKAATIYTSKVSRKS